MAIQKQTLEYFEWVDVEKYICDELGIETSQFRDYNEVVGGGYKDLWHVWMTINQDNISNYSYIALYLDDIDNLMEQIAKYGEWVECLRPVLVKLREEIGDSATIYYDW